MSTYPDLHRELVDLRRGRAVREPQLGSRIGSTLSALSGVLPGDHDRVVQRKVRDTLVALTRDLPHDLRRTAELAFALDPAYEHARLVDRVRQLQKEHFWGERTARRRVDKAVELMVHAARSAPSAEGEGEGEGEPDPGPGWRVRSLSALLRLDTPTPQLYETRTIIATRRLDELTVRLDLPPPSPGDPPAPALEIEALYGARVRAVERSNNGRHHRLTVDLPRRLEPGEPQTFCLHYRVPPGQPIRSHYAIVPLDPCDAGTVRIRFSPHCPPSAVWRLSEVPPRLLDEAATRPGDDVLEPDGVGEVALTLRGLRQGHGYGVAWLPSHSPDPASAPSPASDG